MTGIVLVGAPIVPVQETFVALDTSLVFSSPSGELDLGTCYTSAGESWAHISQTGHPFDDYKKVKDCSGFTQVTVVGTKNIAAFKNSEGKIDLQPLSDQETEDVRKPGGVNPTKVEGTTVLDTMTAHAAIAYDTSLSGSCGAAPTTQTYSYTVTGSNPILYVTVFTVATTDTVSGITYNGSAMTRVGTISNADFGDVFLYRLVGPATGAHNVVVTYTGSPVFGCSTTSSYTGAKQSGGVFVSATNRAESNTVSISITPNSANNWIAMGQANSGTAPFGGGGSATVRLVNANNAASVMYDSNGTVSTGSVTMTSTWSGASNTGAGIVGESFEPVATPSTFSSWQFQEF